MTQELQEQVGATESAPVESEAPPQEATPAAESDPAGNAETDEQRNERVIREREERSQRALKGVQKRIDELTRDKYAERQARERAEREADELRKRLSGDAQPKPDTKGPPRREDFADYDSYMDARAEYRAAQIVEAKLAEAERREQERRQYEESHRTVETGRRAILESAAKFRETVKDFDEAMESLDFEPPPVMERAIATSDNPAAVLYVLGKQPEVARRIAAMDPVTQARAIGAIEFALKSSAKVSQAPAPGKPAGAKGGSSNEPPEDPEAYFRWAEKNLNKR